MELKDTVISRNETCLTYALKRIGIFDKLQNITIEELLKESEFKHVFSVHEKGSVLIWLNKNDIATEGYYIQIGITKDSKVYKVKRFDYGHVAIYEGDNLVSDVNEGEIRLRQYTTLPRPDYILEYKLK